MPKQKKVQLSGAKKRKLAQVKADNERSTVATALRLNRFLVHSKLSETEITESETVAAVATSASSSTSIFQEGSENSQSDSKHCQLHESNVEYSVSDSVASKQASKKASKQASVLH